MLIYWFIFSENSTTDDFIIDADASESIIPGLIYDRVGYIAVMRKYPFVL